MQKTRTAKILGITVAVVGAIVMLGWVADIGVLKSILPQWVTMKFSTATSFLMSGLILYYIALKVEGKYSIGQVVLPIASLIVLLLMATLLASIAIGVRTGIEDLFIKEAEGAVETTTPGRPSIGTMIAFILIGISGMFSLSERQNIQRALCRIGVPVLLLGGLALLGYLFNVSALYYA